MRISDWSSDVCSSDLIDEPGTFNATVSFSSALTESLYITGYNYFHFDVYNSTGDLVDGNDGFDRYLINLEITAGLHGFSFQYSLPQIHGYTDRSDERSVGKDCVSTCRSRWSLDH